MFCFARSRTSPTTDRKPFGRIDLAVAPLLERVRAAAGERDVHLRACPQASRVPLQLGEQFSGNARARTC